MKSRIIVTLVLVLMLLISASALVIGVAASGAEPTLEVRGGSLSLTSSIDMLFAVSYENIEDPENIELLVWVGNGVHIDSLEKGNEDYSLTTEEYVNGNPAEGKLYRFREMAAAEMTENVYVMAYYNGTYSAPFKYSVVQYAYNMMNKDTTEESLKLLLLDMLVYGAEAQRYFGVNTDVLATDTFTEVTVIGGEFSDGMNTALCKVGSTVTLTAESTDELPYVIWTNEAGEQIGVGESFEYTVPSSATTVTAILTFNPYQNKDLKLWYDEPASDDSVNGTPATYTNHATSGWEHEALPIGNGYLGAVVFGRTDRERVQLTDNTLFTPDSGLTNLAETYIYFNHDETGVENYYRDLVLNDAIAHVSYEYDGVNYTREYFTSYVDKVMVIHLTADTAGKLDFILAPEIPFLASETSVLDGTKTSQYDRTGTVIATANANESNITLSGVLGGYNVQYEAQYRIITDGTVTAVRGDENANIGNDNDTCNDQLSVTGATTATILIASGTNYELDSQVYDTTVDADKLNGFAHPHERVTSELNSAAEKTVVELRNAHTNDYKTYFDRVYLSLGGDVPSVTTDVLLSQYNDKTGTDSDCYYLEELFFQYGRYLLIASSRSGGLPSNLNGIWNQYDKGVCGVGYYHNINVMMNYWLAFNTNLSETFEPYADMYKAYVNRLKVTSSEVINRDHPENYDAGGDNGINIGCNVTPYNVQTSDPDSSEGSACGPLMGEVLWDYYMFTQDKEILETIVYPYIYETSKFMTKIMEEFEEYPGLLLVPNAGSPENHVEIVTNGAAFPQQMAYSSYLHTLAAAEILGYNVDEDPLLKLITEQLPKLDPVMVGHSGQIKEFREENFYGEYGEANHRHISQLVALYPGSFINSSTPAWQDAAAVSLELRGGTWSRTGWGSAHRMNAYARIGDGNTAYGTLVSLFNDRINNNLWDTHPPFQIDGNLGATAGIAEMLLQSHENCIAPLAALPDAWASGSYEGLVARGNFVVGASWENGNATVFTILSKNGGECSIKYIGIGSAALKDSKGNTVSYTKISDDLITFNTAVGETYTVTNIPTHSKIDAPTELEVAYTEGGSRANLTWEASDGAVTYNVYRAVNSDPTYTFMGSTDGTSYTIGEQLLGTNQYTYCVTAVGADGRESRRLTCTVPRTDTPKSASGYFLDSTTLQLIITPVATAEKYEIYKVEEDESLTLLKITNYPSAVIVGVSATDKFAVKAVRDGLYSDVCQIEIKELRTEAEDVDNVLLNKHAQNASSVATSFVTGMAPDMAFDGNIDTRVAVKDRAGAFILIVDLGGRYSLDDLLFNECNWLEYTRSPETTVEISSDGGYSWVTVIDAQPLNSSASNIRNTETVFENLGVEVATHVRFTFNNNYSDTEMARWTASFNEIEWSGQLLPDLKVSKLMAQLELEKVDALDLSEYDASAVALLNDAKAELVEIFTQEFPNETLLKNAVTNLNEATSRLVMHNVALGKPVTTSPTAHSAYPATNLVDGIRGDAENCERRFAAGSSSDSTVTVEIDLQGSYYISIVNVVEVYGGRCDSVIISVKNGADSEWSEVLNVSGQATGTAISGVNRCFLKTYEFSETEATHVKMSFTNDDAADKANLYEIEVMGKSLSTQTSNVALNKPATASPTAHSSMPASLVTDGDRATRYASTGTGSSVATVTIDLEGTFLVDSVNVIDFANRNSLDTANRSENIKIEFLVGDTWYTILEQTDQPLGTVVSGINHSNLRTYDFEAHLAEKVRITFENTGENSTTDTPSIFEIEVMGEPFSNLD